MQYLRYCAAIVLMILGFWIIAASVIAGNGVHAQGNALLGMPLAVLGLAICIGAYNTVRRLPREGIYRTAFNVVLLMGSLSLIATTLKFGSKRLSHMDPSEIASQYDTTSYPYAFGFGLLCLATLWLLNARLRPRP